MFLAFALSDIIKVPFGYLMDWLYQFTNNYGLALILFAVLVKVILFPVQAKSKKSMMKMSRLTPKMQAIQAKYAGDQQKQNEAIQALYREEGVSMGGGCLWSFVPLLILIPLYAVVRQPIVYMLHETADAAAQIVEIVKEGVPAAFGNNAYYDEMVAARYIPDFVESIKAAIPTVSEKTLLGINFDFLGVDMGSIPTINVFNSEKWSWDWAHIGGALIPLMSAGSQVLMMKISQDMNNSVVTNEKGIQDKEAAKNSQSAQTSKMMMYTMPIMMLWIGFTVPVVLSLYWMVQGLVSVIQDIYLTKHYRKIYDEEDAIKLQKALEEDRIEAERERVRAERRAANPDGQTQNTSKKKIQKQLREQEAAEKAANAKEYAAKKGIVEEEESESCMSGIPSRPYCKGRNYDPNRYNQEG